MQAFGFHQHGSLEQMTLFELPAPNPGPDDVLIAVKASAFNHLDIWVRQGWPGLKLTLPHISGSDASGDVVSVGENVKHIAIGTRVVVDPGISTIDDVFTQSGEHSESPGFYILGEQFPGTHTEYLVVPAKNVLPIPDHISYEVAAAVGLVGVTAWRMLMHRAQIKLGETILVVGAGGGVNSLSIQLAKQAGCTVYALTSTEEKAALAKTLGAETVINYKSDLDWAKTIVKLTDGQGVDVVVDNVGAATLMSSMKAVKRGGRIVIVGNTSGPEVKLDIRYLFGKQISLIGSTMGNHADFCQVMKLLFEGRIKPVIDHCFPLSQAKEAMALLEQGQQFGKIVLQPA